MDWDVVVIGAGIAGLSAGRVLAQGGLRVVVLEAREHVGGRIRTVRTGAETIELGAEFVHGRPPELWALIEEAGLATYERTGDFLRLEGGELVEESWEDRESDEDDPLEKLKGYAGVDLPFAEYAGGLGLPEEDRAEAIGYVEGFNAADAREASIVALGRQQAAEDAIDGDRVWRIREGYDRLPDFVAERFAAAGGRMVLNATVTAVEWECGRVRVESTEGDFVAAKALVTLPLGVLQSGGVRFTPAPGRVLEAAARMRMGQVCRFTMVFGRRLWPEKMSFLLTRELLPPVWWTAHPAESLSLTGWIGGPKAETMLGLEAAELGRRGCAALAQALGVGQEELLAELREVFTWNWRLDESALGAYSWVPVGGVEASAAMGAPVEGTLFFAGEHTDITGHWGTVHAAIRSGLRAARQVLSGE
jgi:monoamine oxidase